MTTGDLATGIEPGATALAAMRLNDPSAFAALAERYRPQLHVHCYRMLGSVDDADEVVQETFLNAWRARSGFEGRSTIRTWLYRIATHACLRALERSPRRRMPQDVVEPVTVDADWSDPPSEPPLGPDIPWLQPYPDHLLEPPGPRDAEPEEVVVGREPPFPLWFEGRAAITKLFDAFPIGLQGEVRVVPTSANRQPAMASYLRAPGTSDFRLAGLTVLTIQDGVISELATWGAGLPRRSGLPATLGR